MRRLGLLMGLILGLGGVLQVSAQEQRRETNRAPAVIASGRDEAPKTTLIEVEVDVSGQVDTDLLKKGADITVYCQKSTKQCDCNRKGWSVEECEKMLAGASKECAYCQGKSPERGGFSSFVSSFVNSQQDAPPPVAEECQWTTIRRHVDEAQRGQRTQVLRQGNVMLFQVPVQHSCAVSLDFAGLRGREQPRFGNEQSQGLVSGVYPISDAVSGTDDLQGLKCNFLVSNRQKDNPYFRDESPSGVRCQTTSNLKQRLHQYQSGRVIVDTRQPEGKVKVSGMGAFFLGIFSPSVILGR